MSEGDFYFDRVLVMDRSALSGLGLCTLADGVFGRACSEHVTTLAALYQACLCYGGKRLLIITELISDTEPFMAGLALLQELAPRVKSGQCRIMVCTDLSDPILLKVIANKLPSVVVLRCESLSVLREAIRLAGNTRAEMLLSLAVKKALALARSYKLTPRELEWLATQADGMSLNESADVMRVSYKTVTSWRRNIARNTGYQGKVAINQRLAQIRRNVTGELLIADRVVQTEKAGEIA